MISFGSLEILPRYLAEQIYLKEFPHGILLMDSGSSFTSPVYRFYPTGENTLNFTSDGDHPGPLELPSDTQTPEDQKKSIEEITEDLIKDNFFWDGIFGWQRKREIKNE